MVSVTSDLPMTYLFEPTAFDARLHQDLMAWILNPSHKLPPPKYFYDATGSELFDQITRLPEYYLTRTEAAILENAVDDIMAKTQPSELIEIGSGYSRKTQILLEAMHETGSSRYVAFDISPDAVHAASLRLMTRYPWLQMEGVIGDFHQHVSGIPTTSTPLIAFLGSTIGNFLQEKQLNTLRQIRTLIADGGYLLLGVDLVKDSATLEAAYDDSAGVTAEFNRNMLRVMNRELQGDLPVDAFEYQAVFNEAYTCVEMGQYATRNVRVCFDALGIPIHIRAGQLLRTEISCKFTHHSLESLLQAAHLTIDTWYTDTDNLFALALIRSL